MSSLAEQANALVWYHTIELPGGVVTNGLFDARPTVPHLPIPSSLAGKRVLDIGTCDGFWAFELERRGADEVVAIDLTDRSRVDATIAVKKTPPNRAGATFALAHEALESKVRFVDMSVYDLSPDEIGTFDFVFMGSLLLHLKDPVSALQAVRSVVGGQFLSQDSITLALSVLSPRRPAALLRGNIRNEWWTPNKAGRRRELEAAGFRILDEGGITWIKRRQFRWQPSAFRHHPLSTFVLGAKGIPNTWLLAEPV